MESSWNESALNVGDLILLEHVIQDGWVYIDTMNPTPPKLVQGF